MRRPCTELLKYLTSSDEAFQTKAREAKSTWTGCGKDRGGACTSSCSSSSSPSSSSTSSFSSLSSCSSSTASKKKTSSASPSSQQQQQQQQQLALQAQRGESQAASTCSVAGEGAGKWRRCTQGEQSAPIVLSRGGGCGHACSGEEGRLPGLQPAVDPGSLAAARFIRYMHSYSLPPRETGHAGSCGHCLEAGGLAEAGRANRHVTVTIRKRRQELEHPMLSQMLTSRPRTARYRAHLQLPSVPQNNRRDLPDLAPRVQESHGHLEQASRDHPRKTPSLHKQTFSVADQSDLKCSTGLKLDLESWLSMPEQVIGDTLHDLIGQAGEDVFEYVIGSPMSFSQGLPSPLFPDSLVPEHTPSDSQKQALCRHLDDQVPPMLGNHCCIPALYPLPLLL